MSLVVVQPLSEADHDALSVPRMREVFAEVLDGYLVREIVRPDGDVVPVSYEELSRTEVVEQERGVAVGVRPVYEISYREQRVSQAGILQLGTTRFRSHVHYLVSVTLKQLEEYQPGLDWRLVAALVDPVNLTRRRHQALNVEPTPEEVDIRLGQLVTSQLRPSAKTDEAPRRLSNLALDPYNESDWRWYMRFVFADVSGGQDFSDPNQRQGYKASGLARYAETRQLRHLPKGTRRNREEALKLLQRVPGLAVAPAATVAADQAAAAREMVAAGMNVALVARALGVAPAAVQAMVDGPVPEPTRTPRKRS